MFVSSFSRQQDSEWTGRQLIIHYNYKTPMNPDIDSAIDPDQHVRRKEGEAEAHNNTKAVYLPDSFWFSTVFIFIHFPPCASQFVVSAAQDVEAQTQSSSQPPNDVFDSLSLFFKSIFLRLRLPLPRTEC